MTTGFRAGAAAVAALALIALSGCGSKDDSSFGQSGTTLRVGYTLRPGAADISGLMALKAYGRAHDIKVVTRDVASPAGAIASLRRGDIDTASINLPDVVKAVDGGAPLTAILASKMIPEYVFVTTPAITSAAQLKGKRIAIQGHGSDIEAFTKLVLGTAGLTPADASIMTIPMSEARVAALTSHRIDAAGLIYSQYLRVAHEIPGVHALSEMIRFQPHRMSQVWVVSPKFAKSHRAALQTMVDDMLRSTTAAYTPAGRGAWLAFGAHDILKQAPPATRAKIYDFYRVHGMFPRTDQPITAAQYKTMADQMVRSGQLERAAAFSAVWDPSFWQHAAAG